MPTAKEFFVILPVTMALAVMDYYWPLSGAVGIGTVSAFLYGFWRGRKHEKEKDVDT